MKLWEKEGKSVNDQIEKFTIGNDPLFDMDLAPFDVMGSMAHAHMLCDIGILTSDENDAIQGELKNILQNIQKGHFVIEPGIEDVHSQVELLLTQKLGDIGKKIHTGRSRNDQVLVDLKLFFRNEIAEIASLMQQAFDALSSKSETHQNVLIPGYTHLQIAMPSSFGLWFGAYAESLSDDLELLSSAHHIINQNPLGSGAGYGSSFPLNRTLTTKLLGFDDLNYNVVYAQMGRGKAERVLAFALATIAGTIGRFAADACMYMSQNFGFIHLPDEFTTGSSIMPHKKNPDVFELTRAKCNKIQGTVNQLMTMTGNLTSGYFRDYQILKESIFPALNEMKDCLSITTLMVEAMEVKEGIVSDPKYKYIFSVEEVNKLVQQGMPFRDAYKVVGEQIEKGDFNPDTTKVSHSHEGSIGNLCTKEIKSKFEKAWSKFGFAEIDAALNQLIG